MHRTGALLQGCDRRFPCRRVAPEMSDGLVHPKFIV